MRKGAVVTLFVAAVLVCSIAPTAIAQEPAPQPKAPGQWWKIPEVVARLGLTPDQVEAIGEVHYNAALELIDLRATHEKAQIELNRLLDDDKFDENTIQRALARVVDAHCAIFRTEAETRLDVARILTPEQRVMISAHFERRARGPEAGTTR